MKVNRLILFALGLVALIIGMVVFVNMPSSEEEEPKEKKAKYYSNNWKTKYGWKNKTPRGLYFMDQLVLSGKQFDNIYEIEQYHYFDSILRLDNSMYAFIGDNFRLTDSETDSLLQSVYRGSNCFLSANTFSDYFLKELLEIREQRFFYRKAVKVENGKDKYTFWKIHEGDTVFGYWNVMSSQLLPHVDTLFSINDKASYMKVNLGKGEVYLHLNPELYLNYQLLTKDGFKHFQNSFGELKAENLYWLKFANYNPEVEPNSNDEKENDSLFEPLLKNRSFRWALFTFIIGFIFYMLFRSKREQPIVKVKGSKQVTTISYVDTIAGIYFDKKNPQDAYKMMKSNFYLNIQKYFYLDLKKENQNNSVLLSEKSNINRDEIEYLLSLVNTRKEVSFEMLKEFNTALRAFYLKAGIWKEEDKKIIEESYTTVRRSLFKPSVLLLLGGMMLIASFVLLSFSVSFAILLWPASIAALVVAYRMFVNPILRFNNSQIYYYPLFKKKKIINIEEVVSVNNTGIELRFKIFNQEEELAIRVLNSEKKDIHLLEKLVFRINKKVHGRRK